MRRFISAVSLTLMLFGVAAVAQVPSPLQNPVDRVVDAGLMSRYPDGDFRPEQIMSRAELAGILVRAFRLDRRTSTQANAVSLQDVPPDHWAYTDIQTVVRTGVMTGYGEGQFYPNQLVTRAEAFSIFAQAYGVSQFSDEAIQEILVAYPDSGEIPVWARRSLATALYSGFVNTTTGGEIFPNRPMTRADMAYALSEFLSHSQAPDGRL